MKRHAQNFNYRARAPNAQNRNGSQFYGGALTAIATLIAMAMIIGLTNCAGYVTNAQSSGGQPQGPNAGVLTPSPITLSFGSVPVGSTATQNLTVTNTGTATVNISQATIVGASFSVVGGNPSTSLPVGQSSTVQVRFVPTSAATATGTLSVMSDASNSPLTISLSGTGTQSGLAITPASVSFGNVTVGQSATQTVNLTNSGNASLTVTAATISGSGMTINGLSLPAMIGAGLSASFNVQFAPTTAGGVTGSIVFTDGAPNSPQTLILAGSGVAANSTLTANPGSIAFNSVVVGSSSPQSVTLTNNGSTSVTISQASVSGSGFSMTGLSLPLTLAAGQGTSFTAQFAPTVAGVADGSITITSTATNPTLVIAMTGTGTQGHLSANPASVAFGSLLDGSSGSVGITLSNTGTASVTISAASASGTGFSMSGLSTPITLSAGQNTSFTATFAPTAAGSATGSISITSNAPGSPLAIALSGSGTAAQPQLSISPASVSFGNVTVSSNATQNITLTNTGNATLTISAASASGTGFTISGIPTSIPAGQNASFTATFAPTAAGSATGSISITSNAPGSPATIPLSGTGTQGALSPSPSSVSFGSVVVGSSGSQTIILTNTGTASVTISAASASGTGFSISGLSTPLTLGAGLNTTFTAQFSPSSTGSASGSISITSNAPGSPLSIPLSGTGIQPQLSASPTSASFGNVVTGNSNSQTISLTNGGTASLTISQATVSGAGFSITGLAVPATIAAGKNTTFNVIFAPTSSGSVTGSVSLVSNAPNSPLAISLSGTGVAATFLLGANPTSLSFGNVNDGTSSTLSVTLTNNGNSDITISSVTVTGAGYSASGVSSGLILTPNQTATLSVSFAPTTAGAINGSVAVASNATNSPATISVSGTGVAQSSSTVGLTWDASTSTDVTGYFVYRGTINGGPYTKQNLTQVAATTYTDSSVTSGTTYYYVVTAIDSSDVESAYSNQVSATIP